MTKKNKNIIAIIVIFVLLVCLGLTIYFSGCEKKNIKQYNNPRISLPYRYSKKGNVIPKEKFKENAVEDEKESDKDKNKNTLFEEKDGSLSDINNINRIKKRNNQMKKPIEKRNNKGLSCKYVVLISIETFLLGASIMYLVMNNIGKESKLVETTIIEKENEKEKK